MPPFPSPMRLALQTDYALRTLLYLGSRPGRAHLSDIAAFYEISAHHLAKVVHQLGRLGFVRNVRGQGGGVELARDPGQVVLGEVIVAFEGSLQLLECTERDGVCVIQPGCRLRTVLAEAERLQREYLMSVRLADVIQGAPPLVELKLPLGA